LTEKSAADVKKLLWPLAIMLVVAVVAVLASRFAPAIGQQEESRDASPAADDTTFQNPQRVTIRGYDDDAMEPFLTRDGRYLLFNNLNEKKVNTNLHFASRVDDLTFRYEGEIRGVNTPELEGVPTMDAQGTLYFVSPRNYKETRSTIWRGKFTDGTVTELALPPGVSRQQAGWVNFDVEVSPDGNTLYFVDSEFSFWGKPKSADLVIAQRQGDTFVWSPQSGELLKNVNTAAWEYAPAISADGLELFLTRVDRNPRQPPAIFRTTRKTLQEPFAVAKRIAAIEGFVEGPTLSPDERSLYFHKKDGHKKDGDRFAIYRVTRTAAE
jgi:Tol biopolymer transport system component